jgi:TonB-linked SusC/RagA family outer membrane protein
MHVSAHTYSQTVSFKGKNVPLETVFASFEKQTGLSFFFNYALIKDIKPVTVDVREMPLEDALNIILKQQGLSYYRSGKTIFIVRQEAAAVAVPVAAVSPDAKQVNVSGKVTTQQGEVLAGASVEMKNGKKSTLTDAKGIFELNNVPIGAMLVISYTGYSKKEIEVSKADLETVVLVLANNKLDQAQVIAYGATTERLSTGNVTTVTAKEIEQQPVTNPLLALEGRVPGLVVTQTSGMPGSSVTVRIQGQNSIDNGNDPFYVVDGVPYSSQPLQGLSPAGGNPLDFINPMDIESISVLKDADATAIYGSRAANGAILITTKKGKIGKTKFDIRFEDGWSTIAKTLQLLNTPQYLEMRHEAINNDGLTVQPTDYDINGVWDTTRNANWQKILLANSARYANLNADISGGNETTQYFVGATYNQQAPPFPGDFKDQKASLHFGLTTTSTNKRFKLQLGGSYLVDNNQLPGTDLTTEAFRLAPDNPSLLNKDGSLNWALDQNGNSTLVNNANPLSFTLQKYNNTNNNLVSSAVVSYQILSGLDIKANFGYTNQQTNETTTDPLLAIPPAWRSFINSSAGYQYSYQHSWIIEPQANFTKIFGKAKVEALIGTTIQQSQTNSLQLQGSGYSSDLLLLDPQAASTIIVSGTSQSVYKYNAAFGRVGLDFDNSYLVNLTWRRDGTSRFGADNQFHDFGAFGIGWIFSNTDFVKNNLAALSFGKLKASYGITGSDQIGDYNYLSLYTPYSSLPYQGITSLTPNFLTNPYLQWEETKKIEYGIDLGFAKDRILFNATYVMNRSSHQLLSYDLPSITGFESVANNFPATVQNTGGEFSLTTVNIKNKKFSWTTHFNITIPKNKLISFPGLANTGYASSLEIGKPITGYRKVYHFLGVNDTTGIYQVADSKGNATYTPSYGTDNTVVVTTAPKYYGGLGNTITYKNIEIDIFFQFLDQTADNYRFGYDPGGFNAGNQPSYVLDRWRKTGDHASIQRFNSNYAYGGEYFNATYSDAGFSNGSFIRWKNLALSYTLPGAYSSKVGLQDLRIYLQAQNLLTITAYKGLDPENPTSISPGLPPLRVVTIGVKAAF